jgi:hypothetical protein
MIPAWFRAPLTRVRVRRRNPRKSRTMSRSVPIEALEARKLMTFTDVSALAATYARHSGPTNLYINFDGGTVPYDPVNNPKGSTLTIRPFEQEAGDNTANRNRDIQDILFQVSEIFAPFDVQVHRISGSGAYSTGNGDTTVFVGANEANSTTTIGLGGYSFTKYSYSVTYGASLDSPTTTHKINSDPYDVAFVDTVIGSTNDPSKVYASQYTRRSSTDSSRVDVVGIAEGVAHEAGHTFGLSHIRADGLTDPTPLGPGTTNDVMSYDSRNQYFSNKNLNLTSDNNNGTSTTFTNNYPNYLDYKPGGTKNGEPIEVPYRVNFQTQNSFKTLQYLLGVRPADRFANVADTSAVDPTYYTQAGPGTAPLQGLSVGSNISGTLSRGTTRSSRSLRRSAAGSAP